MADNPAETPSDDFLAQFLGFPGYAPGSEPTFVANESPSAAMMLQLGSAQPPADSGIGISSGYGVGGGFPIGLSLEHGRGGGFSHASGSGRRFQRDDVIHSRASSINPLIANTVSAAPHPPAIKPRVRARRGQATDPHSIAERLRRERISERIRALQELVPKVNKTDRAAMLDEIVDYVKFLRLQVKVLSMSRLGGGAGTMPPLATDIPFSSTEEEGGDNNCLIPEAVWEKCSNNGTERQVAKLMEEDVGAAMQFLQSKALCIMPVSLASALCLTQSTDSTTLVNHDDPNTNPSD